jgi:hypothetical protein
LASVLGGCSAEEAEVDRLQDEARQVSLETDQARARVRDEIEAASKARDRAMKALEVRTSLRASRLAGEQTAPRQELTWAQLSFTTDEGRHLFDRFRREEITAVQLRRELSELGEHRVIAQIIAEGDRQRRSDPRIPWPEEQQALREAIAAREQLRGHERQAAAAQADAEQLAQRSRAIEQHLQVARQRLDDCRRSAPRPTFDDL